MKFDFTTWISHSNSLKYVASNVQEFNIVHYLDLWNIDLDLWNIEGTKFSLACTSDKNLRYSFEASSFEEAKVIAQKYYEKYIKLQVFS